MPLDYVRAGYENTGYFSPAKTGTQSVKADSGMFFAQRLLQCSRKAVSDETKTSAGMERMPDDDAEPEHTVMDYQKFFEDKIHEMYVKLQNGETQTSFQIGSLSLTLKEWDEFLEKFDAVEEAIRELMRQEHEKRAEEQLKKQQEMETASNGNDVIWVK